LRDSHSTAFVRRRKKRLRLNRNWLIFDVSISTRHATGASWHHTASDCGVFFSQRFAVRRFYAAASSFFYRHRCRLFELSLSTLLTRCLLFQTVACRGDRNIFCGPIYKISSDLFYDCLKFVLQHRLQICYDYLKIFVSQFTKVI